MLAFERILEQAIADAPRPKPALIFPEVDDPRVWLAASHLRKYAKIILPITPNRLKKQIAEQNITLPVPVNQLFDEIYLVDLDHMQKLKREFSAELAALSMGKKWAITEKEALELMNQPLYFSIMAVRQGFAEAILGGLATASKDYFTPCLRMLRKKKTVFELGLFVLPDEHPFGIFRENVVVFSDVAINLAPDAEALANIAVGTCQIVRDILPESIFPQINGAIISYSTKGSGEGPTVDLVRAAGALIPEKLLSLQQQDIHYTSIHIDWELQMSVALSEEVALKKIKSASSGPVPGHANVLIVTNLDFGNSLYHLYATTWPGALKMLQVGGIYGQALDFSRSSTSDDVVLAGKALILQHLRRKSYQGTPREMVDD